MRSTENKVRGSLLSENGNILSPAFRSVQGTFFARSTGQSQSFVDGDAQKAQRFCFGRGPHMKVGPPGPLITLQAICFNSRLEDRLKAFRLAS